MSHYAFILTVLADIHNIYCIFIEWYTFFTKGVHRIQLYISGENVWRDNSKEHAENKPCNKGLKSTYLSYTVHSHTNNNGIIYTVYNNNIQ